MRLLFETFQQFLDVITLDLVRLRFFIKPPVNRGKGHAQLFGKVFLGNTVFQAVSFESFDDVFHGLQYIAFHITSQGLFSNPPLKKGEADPLLL